MSKKRNGVLKASLSFIKDWFMIIFEFRSMNVPTYRRRKWIWTFEHTVFRISGILNELFLAPEHDIRNTKIMPCENHRNEFNCKTFFNVFATNPKIPVDELVTESYDSFKFNISNIDDDFINFQVSLTVRRFKFTYISGKDEDSPIFA